MAASAQSILADIDKGTFANFYFLEGEEVFYIDKISDAIQEKALSPADREFNLTVVYGKDANVISVLNHARRFPMMAERQVVIVKEAQQLSDFGREKAKEQLEQYLAAPVPTTILVFCYKNKKLDGRQKFSKTIAKAGVFLSTKKMYENQIPTWISEYVHQQGATINIKANQLLTEYIGNNLERLSNEIDKILINYKDRNVEIDDAMVQDFVGINKEYNIFELQNAILYKDKKKVFSIVNYFNANPKNNPPLMVPAQLYGVFSKLLIASGLKNADPKMLASSLKINPYFTKDYVAGLRNFNINSILASFTHLREADTKLKGVNSGGTDAGSIINELMFKLLR